MDISSLNFWGSKVCTLMVKWVRLSRNQYIGFFALGLAFFVLQELPYIIMPLIPLSSNPLMEMQDKSLILNAIEKVFGVSCIVTMMFLVSSEAKWFSLSTAVEKRFFCVAMLAICMYFTGWIFYFSGFQSLSLILCLLVAMPPIYYAFIGLWRKNYVLTVLSGMILFMRTTSVTRLQGTSK